MTKIVEKPKKRAGDEAKQFIRQLQTSNTNQQGLDIMDQYAALVKRVIQRKQNNETEHNPVVSSMLDMTRTGTLGNTPVALTSYEIIGVLASVLLSDVENKKQILDKMLVAMNNAVAEHS